MEDLPKALPHYLEILEKKRKPKFKLHKNLLNKKIKDSFAILKKCELCERKCGVNRFKALGWCNVGTEIKISSYFELIGEEYFFVPSVSKLIIK